MYKISNHLWGAVIEKRSRETASEMRSRYNPELGIVVEKQCDSEGSVVSYLLDERAAEGSGKRRQAPSSLRVCYFW